MIMPLQECHQPDEDHCLEVTCHDFITSFEKVGAILDLGCLSFHHTIRHNFVSPQYLENNYIELYY